MSARQILGFVVLTLIVLFVVFNLQEARVWVFGARIFMPIGIVVLGSAALGAGAMALLPRLRRGKSK